MNIVTNGEDGVFNVAQKLSVIETVCGLNEAFHNIFLSVQIIIIINCNLHPSIDLITYGGYLDF